jgi:hypothetical protein
VTAATSLYYTPYTGNAVPVPVSAGVFKPMAFSEISLALDSTTTDSGYQAAGNLYDIFLYNNSGTLVVGTGPAWSSATTRGTGGGTTQIQMVDGLWVNTNSVTLRLGTGSSNTVSVAAQMALYLRTMYATANGQTEMQFNPTAVSGGSSNVLGLYNAYDRCRVYSKCLDSAGPWTYSSTYVWRPADNSSANRITWVDGLAQSVVEASYFAAISASGSNDGRIGVSFDSASAAPNIIAFNVGATWTSLRTEDSLQSLGLHYAQAMEMANGTVQFYGVISPDPNSYSQLQVIMEC